MSAEKAPVVIGLRKMMPRIGHIQVAPVPDHNEPGTGELDDTNISAEIDTLRYQGFAGCEYRTDGRTEGGLSWFAQRRRCVMIEHGSSDRAYTIDGNRLDDPAVTHAGQPAYQ